MNKSEIKKRDEKLKRAKEIQRSRKKTSINVAAIDQATQCGVAFEIRGSSNPEWELWDLSLKGKQSQGVKWLRFEAQLKGFLKKNEIQLLAYELPAGRHTNAIIHSAKLIGIIEKTCCELEIDYLEISAMTIKKFATGSGNANKELMKEYATKLWNYDGDDDNEADALHILHYLKSLINT